MFKPHKSSEEPAPQEESSHFKPLALDPRRLVTAFRGRRRFALGGTLLFAAIGIGTAKLGVTPEYQARAALEWNAADAGETEGRQLRTVIDSAKLPSTLARVREQLKLDMPLDELATRVNLDSHEQSNVVTLGARSNSPEGAVDLTRAFVDAFLGHRKEVGLALHSKRVAELEANHADADERLRTARAQWHAFCRKHGIVDLEGETQIALEHATRLRGEALSAGADALAYQSTMGVLRRAAANEDAISLMTEKQVSPGAVKLAEKRAELIAIAAQLTNEHPKVRRLRAEVGALERETRSGPASEVAERVVGRNPQWDAIQQSLTTANAREAAAAQREASFNDLAGKATKRLSVLSEVNHDAELLQGELARADERVALLTASLSDARDEARNASSGFRVLDGAAADPFPVRSLRRPVAIGITALGLLLSVLLILLRELRGARIRTAAELSFWSGLPVVLASRWPLHSGGWLDVMHALRTLGKGMTGTLLLVGFDRQERRWSRLIMRQVGKDRMSHSEMRVRRARATWSAARLRREARSADLVLVLVSADEHRAWSVMTLNAMLGRADGVGAVLLGVGADLELLPDQAGAVATLRGGAGTDKPTGARAARARRSRGVS